MQMDDTNIRERIFEQKSQGRCCSQIIMALCLEDMGKENEDLIRSMTAFCGGMGRGKICGTLAAAIAALHVKDQAMASALWQEEYMDWFEDSFDGYDCYELIADDPVKRLEFCPVLIIKAYVKLMEYICPEKISRDD